MIAYKLFRLRKDGTLGPLFINRKQVIPIGKWLQAECHPTAGYAVRPGWHCCSTPCAPHLSKHLKNGEHRVWARVEIKGVKEHMRPESQGGLWYTAEGMMVLKILGGENESEESNQDSKRAA
jgi:hypothetical protein